MPVPDGAAFTLIGPETIRQLNLFAHKVILCLHFEHLKVSLVNDGRVIAFWRSKEDDARDGIPKLMFDTFPEYGTLAQGKWTVSEAFEYRYAINKADGLFACLARFRHNLFVTGFTVTDAAVAERVGATWLKPSDLLDAAKGEAFMRRH